MVDTGQKNLKSNLTDNSNSVLYSDIVEKPEMYKLSTTLFNGLKSTVNLISKNSFNIKINLNTRKLPKQPIPQLKDTAERYLRSVKPLLNDDEYCKTEAVVKKFMNNEAPKLHEKLLERYNSTDNWMSEWWLQGAYLGYRYPVIVHSSPGTVGPEINCKDSNSFALIAARLIHAVFDYDHMVKSGSVKQEFARDEPLDMQPYGMILGTHRQPAPTVDKLLHHDDAEHIIIICNNNFYKLKIVNESSVLTENNLTAAIKDIIERSQVAGEPVGILTGNDRDTWANDYNILISLGKNRDIVKDIETSLFVLCLDRDMPKEAFQDKNIPSVRAVQCMTGYSTDVNAANRWHDKTVQYIISKDGCIGMQYEHSPCEGGPIAVLHDHVLNYVSQKENAPTKPADDDFCSRAALLKFELNDAIETAVKTASRSVNELASDIDMECFKFDRFGSDGIKGLRMSPDSFIQVAMNATFYKVQGKPAAHYESAALRRFQGARTECIRSTSAESVEFARMLLTSCSVQEKRKAMLNALNTHKKLVSEAVVAQGVDRHLFGLKKIALAEGTELPEFYKDVGYTRSTHFTLTSSQVAYKTESFMCYGPVVPEGYGCCYNPRPKDILFACSSFKSCASTCTKDFARVLNETLIEMLEIAKS